MLFRHFLSHLSKFHVQTNRVGTARALHGQTVLVSRPAKMVSLWEVTAILAPTPRAVFFSSISCQIVIKRKKNELRDDTYIHTYIPFGHIFKE